MHILRKKIKRCGISNARKKSCSSLQITTVGNQTLDEHTHTCIREKLLLDTARIQDYAHGTRECGGLRKRKTKKAQRQHTAPTVTHQKSESRLRPGNTFKFISYLSTNINMHVCKYIYV